MNVSKLKLPENLVWINTQEPLDFNKLKGHVILLDFWTYCCINCIHVLDDLKYLEEKYENDPFLVIGVHSPKFRNEKDIDNIRSAVARYEITHPVLVDNDLILWRSFGINVWPSVLLIGTDGKIIGKASGEGKRSLLDSNINKALEKGREQGSISSSKYITQPDITLESKLKFPGKLSLDAQNNYLYVSDSNHNRVLEVLLEDNDIGTILKVFGSGNPGFRDGSIDQAEFNKPQGILFHDNRIYVADTENHAVRMIDLEHKEVSTIAGTGKQGITRTYNGDPLKVALSSPWDLIYHEGFIYIAMAGIHQIWRYKLKNNLIESFAGSGREDIIDGDIKEAALAQPSGLSIDKMNNRLYFADSEVSALRYIDLNTGKIFSLIGKGLFKFGLENGAFNESLLQHPLGVEFVDDVVYIADTYNHAIRIASLEEEKTSNLIYRPKKGICKIGDEDCDVLPLYEPNDVLFHDNKLYIADTNNHLIRIYKLEEKKLTDLYLLDK